MIHRKARIRNDRYKQKARYKMVKDYLRSVRNLNKEIEAKKKHRESLYYLVTGSSIKIKTVNVQESAPDDKLAAVMAEVDELDRKISDDIIKLTAKQAKALEMINSVSKSEYRSLLIHYYLNAYSWDKTASMLGYSIQHIFRMHGEALRELDEKDESK